MYVKHGVSTLGEKPVEFPKPDRFGPHFPLFFEKIPKEVIGRLRVKRPNEKKRSRQAMLRANLPVSLFCNSWRSSQGRKASELTLFFCHCLRHIDTARITFASMAFMRRGCCNGHSTKWTPTLSNVFLYLAFKFCICSLRFPAPTIKNEKFYILIILIVVF